jgi:hypothetical protein
MAPKKSGQVLRLEPEELELFKAYPEIKKKFIDAGWFEFCCNFQEHHKEILMLFAKNQRYMDNSRHFLGIKFRE